MKIKTFNRTWPIKPSECQHEWRLFGTRMEEEVWTPIRTKPPEKQEGWVICDKCGWSPFVYNYRVIGKRPYIMKGWTIPWNDVRVEILEWGTEKQPTEPIVETFAYAEWTWWDKVKRKLKDWIETFAIAGSFGGL